jgi:tetratricopeptide (TPR) repeat protein
MTQPILLELVKSDGEAGFAKFTSQMIAKEPRNPALNESGINSFGYWIMTNQRQIGLAIKVFTVNVRRYPKSANVYDSLAEGYLTLGNKAKAIEWYQKALKVDPAFPSSIAALKKLGAK